MDIDRSGDDPSRRRWPDDALVARLADLFAELDPPPAELVELAKLSFGLRTVDAELAALTADSDQDQNAVSVRSAGLPPAERLLTFESADLAVEVEVTGTGRALRLLGQLIPPGPARIEVRQPAVPDPRSVRADERGRFVVEGLQRGPVSLACHRPGRRTVATEWTGLG